MPDQSQLSSRAIIGRYYARLEQNPGLGWVNGVANLFPSDQASERYEWLGAAPTFRRWIGGRQAQGLRGAGVTVVNDHYEATLEIDKKDARRDKTGQVMVRVDEFADQGQTHWASLLTNAIVAGETSLCYDGQYFFDTDHSEGDSGTQSNLLSHDISAMPTQTHGTATAPSVEEIQISFMRTVASMLSIKNDRGEPMNENAREFLFQVPVSLYLVSVQALTMPVIAANTTNLMPNLSGFRFGVEMNPRLTWTDKYATFRTDSPIKALLRQTEQEIELKAKAEGSEFEFDHDRWQFGIDAWRGVGYGYWQRAALTQLV